MNTKYKKIFTNYDLMQKKCKTCKKKKPCNIEYFLGKDIFFCSETRLFADDYIKYGKELCLSCYNDFIIENIDYSKYNIYKINN